MTDLRPAQFSDFFRAVHGVDPFPWQEKLAQTVYSANWPHALDIPTGAGKTAAIDIAVFHLALEADRGAERQAAARILFVVDRRLIVDEAYERAVKIADKLSCHEPILKAVAERLRNLAEDGGDPLAVARLRSGMPKEPDWVRTPSQPTVVVSTVDQTGSRLLFRGYGVSDTMKPIHAGLLGVDSLLLLDEAHLSQPFLQTVRDSLRFRHHPWSESRAPAPFRFVTLSATLMPGDAAESEPFGISEQDRVHPGLSRRLAAPKPTELIEEKSEPAVAEWLAEQAWQLREFDGNARVVAIVVNRVRRARTIFNSLLKKGALPFGKTEAVQQRDSTPQAALLIGRVRPLDRDNLMLQLLPFIGADESRSPPGNPLIVVATQCIEAGANLDFDVLLTEIAPLDCLRQRFGRLNRMGREVQARGAIVASADQIKKSADDDPIYGAALKSAWNLLLQKSRAVGRKKGAHPVIDFGVLASELWFPGRESLSEYLSPEANAPILMPSTVQLWSGTAPIPFADPQVSLYLHGPQGGQGDVEIVWRADLDDGIDENEIEKLWTELLAVCPPASEEAISVPIGAARNWLSRRAAADFGDTEPATIDSGERGDTLRALRWRGLEESGIVSARDLLPGDVIVVPSARGGCDGWGWNPTSRANVSDLGREANARQRLRDILRLSRAEVTENDLQLIEDMKDWSDGDVRDHFSGRFNNLEDRALRKLLVMRSHDRRPIAIERKLPRTSRMPHGDAVTEDDTSVKTGESAVLLSVHSKGVEEFVRCFAIQAGLTPDLVNDLAIAGYLHDAGKAHRDFKRFLYGGDDLAAVGPDLAKSANLPGSRSEWEELRQRSGLPKRARHEIASLQFAQAHSSLGKANDPELVLWLVGTHHGHGRPFFPAPEKDWPRLGEAFEADLGDGNVRALPAESLSDLASRWFDLSERVAKRYGGWGLAWLEAILRLADHRQSEKEQE